ncbi:MAG: flagellar biosynthesis protein FlhF, partial [SAR86 cluster bacterium]
IDSSWRFALGHLSRRVPVLGRDLSAGGGMFAFLGAAGVGKTTTIGKLATRYVLEHGPDAVALVTTDHYRVAAHEQLRSLGNILGVTVRVVDDNHSLSEVLLTLRNKSLVLIDTAGLNVLDPNFNKQLDMLNQNGARVQNLLLMASTSQKTVLQREYQAYSKVNLSATVITKVDDTASIGECLSLATEKQLPIAYETHGQNIPDDIAVAHGTQLVNKAVELSQRLELNREQIITEFRDSFSVENLAKQPIASFN